MTQRPGADHLQTGDGHLSAPLGRCVARIVPVSMQLDQIAPFPTLMHWTRGLKALIVSPHKEKQWNGRSYARSIRLNWPRIRGRKPLKLWLKLRMALQVDRRFEYAIAAASELICSAILQILRLQEKNDSRHQETPRRFEADSTLDGTVALQTRWPASHPEAVTCWRHYTVGCCKPDRRLSAIQSCYRISRDGDLFCAPRIPPLQDSWSECSFPIGSESPDSEVSEFLDLFRWKGSTMAWIGDGLCPCGSEAIQTQ